jgi:HD-like signal output (HDOD) protein
MQRVLLVLADPAFAASVESVVRDRRCGWELTRVSTRESALTALREGSFQVVVRGVGARDDQGEDPFFGLPDSSPACARIALLSDMRAGAALGAMYAAHRCLPHPCDPSLLVDAIARCLALAHLLPGDELRSRVSGVRTVPAVPSLHRIVLDELRSTTCSLAKVGRIVESDPGMAAQILRLVHSLPLGPSIAGDSVERAVVQLGAETVNVLSTGMEVFVGHDRGSLASRSIEAAWRRNHQTAMCSRVLAKAEGLDPRGVCHSWVAAMLADIGMVVLARGLGARYEEVLRIGGERAKLAEFEDEVLGASHAEVGAYLLGLWGMPDPVVEAVALHETGVHSAAVLKRPRGVVLVAKAFVEDALGAGERLHQMAGVRGVSERMPVWRQNVDPVLALTAV